MDKPLISVILLTYNQENYVAQAIESVLDQQTDYPYEIIIGEDASTDGTALVCRSYAERYPDRIVLVESASNKGLLRNYFDCLQMARGEFIADCAGDDFCTDRYHIQSQTEWLLQHPSFSAVSADWEDYDMETGTHTVHQPDIKADICDEQEWGRAAAARFLGRTRRPEVSLSASIYRKQIILEALTAHPDRFISDDMVCEDISVTAALLMAGPIAYQAHPSQAYRHLPESVNHSKDRSKYFRFCVGAFCQTIAWARFLEMEAADIQPYLNDRSAYYMDFAFRSRNASMARQIRQAMRSIACRLPWKAALKYRLTLLSSAK